MVSGTESTEAGIVKMLEGVFSQWKGTVQQGKPGGDVKLADTMEKLTLSLRKLQMSEENARKERMVRSHIERRAELRDKTGIRMPNMANILAGGAESPMAGLGRMQGQASKPFKNVWDYQKAKGEAADLGKIDKSKRSEEEQDRLDYLEKEMPGKERRAKSGFGKNLMGKKMQGMIGKVGKFMESSKGQGMMAGGMMGASILTMIIKKAMEASPMLQQMLKIMNVAMTLFLRPIGDFIGGMLKPIMLFFLREVAIPMMKAGKGMIKYGEVFGKQVLGFLLKPVETIQHAIQAAIHWDEGVREISSKFDGIKEWMTEQKMTALASEMGYGGPNARQDLIDDLNAPQGNVDRTTRYSEGGAIITLASLNKELLAEFKALKTDLKTKDYVYATAYGAGGIAGGVGAGMGAVAEKFSTSVSEASGKVVTALELLAETLNPTKKPEITPTPGDTTGTTPTTGVTVYDQPQLPHWTDISVYDTVGKMFAAASQQMNTRI